MSSKAPEHAATNPPRRTEINVPKLELSCPDCQRRQELLLQMGLLADAKAQEAESYKRLYEAVLLEVPTVSRAA